MCTHRGVNSLLPPCGSRESSSHFPASNSEFKNPNPAFLNSRSTVMHISQPLFLMVNERKLAGSRTIAEFGRGI